MAEKWLRSEAVLAQRLSSHQLSGVLRKRMLVSRDEELIIEEQGKFLKRLGAGEQAIGSVFSGKDIIMIDTSEKSMIRDMNDLWTADDKEINCSLELKLRIKDTGLFCANMLKNRHQSMLEDVWQSVAASVKSVVRRFVKKKKINGLLGGSGADTEIKAGVLLELKKRLDEFGMEVASVRVGWILPDEYEGYLKRRSGTLETSEKRELELEEKKREAVHEMEIGEIKGDVPSRERTLAEIENEKLRRESEIALSREETQEDMLEAIEAVRLKKLKGGKDAGEGKDDAGKLKKLHGETRKAMEAVEKKYLKREIDEQAFRQMMQDYRKKLAEIEVRMEARG